ncbi:MAG TPA: hypothetical protein VGS17_11425 [Candidatus Limnocylindria bacterium]|nr:hypothetical protein [Candidatus Limnocylindria bacterium]
MTRVVAGLVVAVEIAAVAVCLISIEYSGAFVIVPIALSPFALVGALLIVRVPRNAVGWLLSGSGVLFGLIFAGGAYGWLALIRDPGHLPGGEVAAALATTGFIPAISLVVFMLLVFPSGHGLGGRWARLERALVPFLVLITFVHFLQDVPVEVGTGSSAALDIANPFAVHGPLGQLVTLIAQFSDRSTIVLLLVGPLSLFIRYRRSSAVERAQIKWLAYSGTLALVLVILSNVIPGDLGNWLFELGLVALGTLPIAIAIAILRYRLYDIDVLIRRTLVYAVVSAVLLAAYLGGLAVFETLLAPFTAGNGIAVAISTLAVVALFQPVRRRIQSAVDHRFFRAKYDAERTLDAFAARLRDQVDLGALERELISAVRETVQPAHASMWLRQTTR